MDKQGEDECRTWKGGTCYKPSWESNVPYILAFPLVEADITVTKKCHERIKRLKYCPLPYDLGIRIYVTKLSIWLGLNISEFLLYYTLIP